jgi:hypothetical protein
LLIGDYKGHEGCSVHSLRPRVLACFGDLM